MFCTLSLVVKYRTVVVVKYGISHCYLPVMDNTTEEVCKVQLR